MNRLYGNRVRTDKDRLTDALFFCAMATPAMIAYKTAADICADKGVQQAKNREAVAKALLRRQMALSNA